MVAHWRRVGGPHACRNLVINGVGAAATAVTLGVILIAKLSAGAWITLLLIPLLLIIFTRVQQHHAPVARAIACETPLDLTDLRKPIVVVPIKGWDKIARKGLRFALKLSPEVYAVQVCIEGAEAECPLLHRRKQTAREVPQCSAGCSVGPLRFRQWARRDMNATARKEHHSGALFSF